MEKLEKPLVDQCKSKLALESQLSAMRNCIGVAKRRSKETEKANKKLQEEMKFWNRIYSQDTGVDLYFPSWNPAKQQSSPMQSAPISASIPNVSGLAFSSTVLASVPISLTPSSAFSYPIQMDMNTRSFASEFSSENWTFVENFVSRGIFVISAASAAMHTNTH